jgi:glyoxylase-like metal-dependent hydrolase (beta-lactamase superfamily II)
VPTPITYTFCYVLEADGRLLVIDPGWASEAAREALQNGLTDVGRTARDIDTVLVTHLHPDHVGLATWLLDHATDATLRMHPEDLDRILPAGQQRRLDRDRRWSELMQTVGAPDELAIGTRVNVVPPLSEEHAARSLPVSDGEQLRHGVWTLEVMWTPGHTRGHFVLIERAHRLLFSGDHILPTVTPAVTMQGHADDDILGDYLASLRATRNLPVDEVLPGHQYRFSGLAARVDQMLAHHDVRFSKLVEEIADRPGASCYTLAERLQWSDAGFGALPRREKAMAARETLAHLTHLRVQRRVNAERLTPTGAVTTWSAAERTT